ncbi:GNAT family N-acetyltransferase [Patescibacteria group bacterium]|nr:GNAT family N-acetyltransferase [Patescibacteria group bacterium]
MEIIQATKEHISKISEINSVLDTEQYHFSSPDSIERFIEKGQYFIAVENGEILGAISIRPIDGSYQIFTIATAKSNEGIGSALVEFAINKCKEDGIKKLWCWSLIRYDAKGFYESMGFEEEILLKKQWHNEDCYLFGKVIT